MLAALAAGFSSPSAARVRLENGSLWIGGEKFVVRGVTYSITLSTPCLYARDLPLIAAMGANTVLTHALLSEEDSIFLPLLESTNLYWLAGFPLEPFHDPAQTITAKKEQILDAFRKYAVRFRGQSLLIGYIFGSDVTEGYNAKFAGSPTEFYALLDDVVGVLRELEPEDTPLLATAVRDVNELRSDPPALSFWAWNTGAARAFSGLLGEVRQTARTPVLVSEYGGAFNQLPGQEEEEAQAEVADTLTRQIQGSDYLLGGVYAGFHPLFRVFETEQPGVDSLRPRAVFRTLATLWADGVPPEMGLQEDPSLEKLEHAASGARIVSPGALVRLTGSAFANGEMLGSSSEGWPVHIGTTCLCVGNSVAPLGFVSPGAATAQIPWEVEPGDYKAVLFRAGAASNFTAVRIRKYAPGIFPGAVVRAGTRCTVSAGNGVRPGELLEVYATGLGHGTDDGVDVEAVVNNIHAEVLYAGLLPYFVGLNQVNLRVDPLTPPSPATSLEVRIGGVSSNPYPLSVAAFEDRPGITLNSAGGEVLLQAGGELQLLEIQAEGVNSYCGPVLFSAVNLPEGLSFRVPVAFTGQTVSLELRASAASRPVQGGSFLLFGHASGALSGSLAVRFTVLPSRGEIPVRVVSGGYKSKPLARFDWNGRTLFSTTGGGPGRGINVLTVDPVTGVFFPVRSFDTWSDETASDSLVHYLSGLPDGTIALFAVADDGSLLLTAEARTAVKTMFGSRFIQGLGYQQSWAMIARKGAPTPVGEGASLDFQVILDKVLTLPWP